MNSDVVTLSDVLSETFLHEGGLGKSLRNHVPQRHYVTNGLKLEGLKMEPTAYDVAPATLSRGRHAWSIVVPICPQCGKRTAHGGGPVTKPPAYGWRQSHCCRASIYLVPALEDAPEVAQGP